MLLLFFRAVTSNALAKNIMAITTASHASFSSWTGSTVGGQCPITISPMWPNQICPKISRIILFRSGDKLQVVLDLWYLHKPFCSYLHVFHHISNNHLNGLDITAIHISLCDNFLHIHSSLDITYIRTIYSTFQRKANSDLATDNPLFLYFRNSLYVQ